MSPFPLTHLSNLWEWHRGSKVLAARLGEEGFKTEFERLIRTAYTWGMEVDDELVGFVALDPSSLTGEVGVTDAQVHVAVARKAWGKGVIQTAAQTIIPTFFAAHQGLRRLTVWTAENNYPARAVADDLGFELEGKLRDGVSEGTALLLYGLTRRESMNAGS